MAWELSQSEVKTDLQVLLVLIHLVLNYLFDAIKNNVKHHDWSQLLYSIR